eukprot:m.544372 g.544372  ORF g.544372 m.544372 type:complete len:50 (+) comp22138_c0_seq19:2549-2698(+)
MARDPLVRIHNTVSSEFGLKIKAVNAKLLDDGMVCTIRDGTGICIHPVG